MENSQRIATLVLGVTVAVLGGCAAPTVDFATIERPARPAELEAYNVFAGTWNWEAEMLNAEGPDKTWTGTAEWRWTLDKRCLFGLMSTSNPRTAFESEGIWSWHPKSKKYVWWMFNNWGYPQEGTADYDEDNRTWSMRYTSVGLDGGTSHGKYTITVVDDNTLEWSMAEWADALHLIKKTEMTGTYHRKQ